MTLVNMIRTGIVRCLAAKATAATERKQHKLDIHVDQNDPAVMRLALANSSKCHRAVRRDGRRL